MNVTLAQAEKILKGNHTFSQLGFSLLITRLKGIYSKDSSHDTVQTCMSEINMFLDKYSAIMSSDFTIISKL
ncbi:MAG: hypothetical protein FWH33_08350 [Oscillospiraceae bacterium]|nr:hypothetical protein [Oscillospiraceae bacterium]